METGVLIAVVIAGLASLTQIAASPEPERRRSFRAIGFYAVFLICGVIALLFLPLERGGNTALFGTLGILVWIALGIVWLLRISPGQRPPPAWVLKPWTALDWVLIALVIVCGTLAVIG